MNDVSQASDASAASAELGAEEINAHTTPSRPGIVSWLVAGSAFVGLIVFLVFF
ncbi:MAG: hypothetical protein O7C66_05465 [Alphaproteobacteria bacterium]|nr:hypothetical protein [Alphaproteobacteria bacterium]